MTYSPKPTAIPTHQSLELLLFVDDRNRSQNYIQQVKDYLNSQTPTYPYDLQVIEIREQPHLLEHYKLVAIPALIKIAPGPRQSLAGSDLIKQLDRRWQMWQYEISETIAPLQVEPSFPTPDTSEGMLLKDEIFKLKQEKEDLLNQLRFKDQMLAMLAHDLRSPLTAASMAVDTLELAQAQPNIQVSRQLQHQLYKQAKQQFRLMNRMITDLLEASKSMSNHIQLQLEKVYLQELGADILLYCKDRFHKKGQTIITDLPQDLPPVLADPELIRQVINNLLENASKYTPEGSIVTFAVLHRTHQQIQVSVVDNGPGIPEEKQESIFEGHFRLKRDEKKEGYGLGLFLCRKIIHSHSGQIWVDSSSNRGSAFNFTLPVYSQ